MLYLDDLKYMKLFKKRFYLPINMDDKKHGSAILLLSPSYEASVALMKSPYLINKNRSFEHYYMERDILYTIQNESRALECDWSDGIGPINEQAFIESTDIHVWDDLNELAMNELYCQLGDRVIFFNEMYDEALLEKALGSKNSKYKAMLYNDRIRNNKAMFKIFDQVKSDVPAIRKTYINLARYKSFNCFFDLYYYNQSYLSNNRFTVTKSIDMYFEFIRRFILDKRIDNAGYTKKTVFIPLWGWNVADNTQIYDFRRNLNFISVFYKKLRMNPDDLAVFDGIDFVFFGKNGYFKYNHSHHDKQDKVKFVRFITTLYDGKEVIDDSDTPDNSPAGITTSIIDKLETNKGIEIHSLTGMPKKDENNAPMIHNLSGEVPTKDAKEAPVSVNVVEPEKKEEPQKKTSSTKSSTTINNTPKTTLDKARPTQAEVEKKQSEDTDEKLKKELVAKINQAAENSADEEQTLAKLDQDEDVKRIIMDLQDSTDDGVKLSATRVNRITKNQDNFMKKQIAGMTVAEMVNDSNKPEELPETALPIDTINEEWKHLKTVNFEKEYSLEADIMKILNSFSDLNKNYPISILDVQIEDTSTSEDYVYTYTVRCEGYDGKRFTLKFDIPKFRDNRFMRLRGNEKIFSIEMPLLPISKTEEGTAQLSSLYNKIGMMTYYTSKGKSNPYADKLTKALTKYKGKDIKVTLGDNSRICSKYELPIDYIDLAGQFNKIEFYSPRRKEDVTIYFNQDEIRKIPGVNAKYGIPIALTSKGTCLYYNEKVAVNSRFVTDYITSLIDIDDFIKLYNEQSVGKKNTYSRMKVMNSLVPTIVVLCHDIGLFKAMDLAGINYTVYEKRQNNISDDWDVIRLSDAYIYYEQTYTSMMLMNGLKECDLKQYSIKDINSKVVWLEVLDDFGGRIISDGLDNFKDLMFDPITVEICKDYGLPTTYHEALIYANNLLVDNKYAIHTDISTNRYRTNEVIAAHLYKVLASAYASYALNNKHGRKVAMGVKQSAVIDAILAQNTTSDLSIFQPLYEIETKNMISTKGVVGMNEERAYKIDKRGYDDSMVNIIAQSTGFASTVGVNRQTTINPQIVGGRGYFKQANPDDMSITNTLGMTEALSPFMLTSDDPFRNDMTFVQTSKHSTPIEYSTPLLVTTGADAAMPYLCSDMFAHKAKLKGKVTEITDKHMIVEYTDGSKEFVNLDEQTMKNSDGGFYITLKLKTDLKEGQIVKPDQILAYDEKSFSKQIGSNQAQLVYNIGCLTKCAIMTTEDGYEDSGVCSEWLSEAMSSDIVVMKPVELQPMTNILFMARKGQEVHEGDPVLIFQNAFDEEDANLLLKNLNNEDGDVTEIGRNVIKSKVTGEISDIKIYRTCDVEECSESLQKIIKNYYRDVNREVRAADGATNWTKFDSVEKLTATGKMKGITNGVLIEIYMKYHDKLSAGDKLSSNANKAVLMSIYDDANAPYSEFRPNEAIDMVNSCSALDGRMITSIIKNGALNKAMIELQRKVCDTYGIKWKDLHEIKG